MAQVDYFLKINGVEGESTSTAEDRNDLVARSDDSATRGQEGSDLLIVNNGDGSDFDEGGQGSDILTSDDAADTVHFDAMPNEVPLFGGNYSPASSEEGSLAASDIVSGDTAETQARGGTGADVLIGGEGADIFRLHAEPDEDANMGGTGADVLIGGEGADIFRLQAEPDEDENTGGSESTTEVQPVEDFTMNYIEIKATSHSETSELSKGGYGLSASDDYHDDTSDVGGAAIDVPVADDKTFEPEKDDSEPGEPTRPDPGDAGDSSGDGERGEYSMADLFASPADEGDVDSFVFHNEPDGGTGQDAAGQAAYDEVEIHFTTQVKSRVETNPSDLDSAAELDGAHDVDQADGSVFVETYMDFG